MEISFFSVLCGIIVTISETYGINETLLKNKMRGESSFNADSKYDEDVVSIRLKDGSRIFQTAYLIEGIILLTTATFVMELDNYSNSKEGKTKLEDEFEMIDLLSDKQNLRVMIKHVPKAYLDNVNSRDDLGFNRFDIGILGIVRSFTSHAVRSINLAKSYDTKMYSEAHVYRWVIKSNVTRNDGTFEVEQRLRKINVKLHTREECADKYNLKGYNFPIDLLCIESPSKKKRLQKIDLGSPVINGDTMIGIISHVPDNTTDLKAVMVNMKIVSPWILKTLGCEPNGLTKSPILDD